MSDHNPKATGTPSYPCGITSDEIDSIPQLQFAAGIDASIFLFKEHGDTWPLCQGHDFQEPGGGHYHRDPSDFDRAHHCLDGYIRPKIEEVAGQTIHLKAPRGGPMTGWGLHEAALPQVPEARTLPEFVADRRVYPAHALYRLHRNKQIEA